MTDDRPNSRPNPRHKFGQNRWLLYAGIILVIIGITTLIHP